MRRISRRGGQPRTGRLATFAVPLGLAGLGGVWAGAEQLLGAPGWIALALAVGAAVSWLAMTVRYTIALIAREQVLKGDLAHPGTGPLVAYVPVIGLILVGRLSALAPLAAEIALWVLVGLLLLVAAALVVEWLTGAHGPDSVHGGYSLPVIAGPFVATIALTSNGFDAAAEGAFALGVFFWAVLGPLVLGRMMIGTPLDRDATPQFSLLLAPPATGGLAWMVMHPDDTGVVGLGFASVIGFFVVVQLLLLPTYFRTRITFALWIFAFPVTSTANFAIRWLHAVVDPQIAVSISWVLVALSTVIVVAIAVVTAGASIRMTSRTSDSTPLAARP